MKNIVLKFIYRILASYARKVIRQHKPFVIGITGSSGKTSTKEAVYRVMADHFGDQVRKTEGNLNAEIGIPLTILGYKSVPNKFLWPFFLIAAYFRTMEKNYPKYLVLEMGLEHPGDFGFFGSIVSLNIGVITTIDPAHFANFKDLAHFQAEKLALIKLVHADGKIIINADDGALAKLEDKRILGIGIAAKEADYGASDIVVTTGGTDYRINTVGQKIAIKSKLIGKQFIYSQLIAFAIGQSFGIQSLEIKKSLEKISTMPGRMRVIEGKSGILILDDTYNANPGSMGAALDVLSEIKYAGRKVAILGNMNELGAIEKAAHEEIGKYAKGKCDFAIFVSPNADLMAKGFADSKNSLTFSGRLELLKSIDRIVKPKDLILIKASQNRNFFEEVTKYLMKDPTMAKEMLVRQSDFWKRRKNSY